MAKTIKMTFIWFLSCLNKERPQFHRLWWWLRSKLLILCHIKLVTLRAIISTSFVWSIKGELFIPPTILSSMMVIRLSLMRSMTILYGPDWPSWIKTAKKSRSPKKFLKACWIVLKRAVARFLRGRKAFWRESHFHYGRSMHENPCRIMKMKNRREIICYLAMIKRSFESL